MTDLDTIAHDIHGAKVDTASAGAEFAFPQMK